MKPELVVTADMAVAATEDFLALAPRTVALAGGSTPRRLYERLATCTYPWSETEVLFGDERCVPPDHPRLTLTLPVLSAAKVALFLVSGAGKREALRRLLQGDDIPAARVGAKQVIIFADEAASR